MVSCLPRKEPEILNPKPNFGGQKLPPNIMVRPQTYTICQIAMATDYIRKVKSLGPASVFYIYIGVLGVLEFRGF